MERVMQYKALSRVFITAIYMVLIPSITYAEEIKPEGRVTIAGKIARFHFFGKMAETLLYQIGNGKDFEGLVCLKKRKDDTKLEKILDEKIYPVECWLSVSLKKGKLVEIYEENEDQWCVDAVYYKPHSESIEWDKRGNKRPRTPDYVDYEDMRNGDALPRFSDSPTSLAPRSEINRGYDLMAAKIEGKITIIDRKAQFSFVGQTAEAMYYQHAEDKNFEGMGCTMLPSKDSESGEKSSQFHCWMNIDLKTGNLYEPAKEALERMRQ